MQSNSLSDLWSDRGALYDTKVTFTLKNKKGNFAKVTTKIDSPDNGVHLTHIESRPSLSNPGNEYDYFIDCFGSTNNIQTLVEQLKDADALNVQIQDKKPWIPMRINDLDKVANQVQSAGKELKADHPGFTDPVYRKRREYFADIANNYKHGQPIPRVKYTEEEIKTWGKIFRELTKLFPTHACKEHNRVFPLLVQKCGYREDNIPQLQDISDYMKKCTGFTLRPVAGLLSSRDFLAGLAFKVFHSTQYIRHSSKPMYSPEPDVCHELIGHAPLLCDPEFAQFSQELGLASLGAPDDYIDKLSTLYWFTIEFGVCKQDGVTKAYGAGLLSSFGELEYCLSDVPEVKPFDPAVTAVTEFPITEMQPLYFLAESFQDARQKLIDWCRTIPKPYNPQTQSIGNKQAFRALITDIKQDVGVLEEALLKIHGSI